MAEGVDYYEEIAAAGLNPLWKTMAAMVPREPSTRARPAHWRYATVRRHLMQAGGMLTAEEAERRVLQLQNPGLSDMLGVSETLYAGLQLVMPGEIAPAHRHTMNAIRFVVEGEGAYTTIEGDKVAMHRGDFIVTPGWTFHDHGNETDAPVIWLDGLDGPLINRMGANFAEPANAARQLARGGDNDARFAQSLVPVDWEPKGAQGPCLSYPYARSRPAVTALRRDGEVDPCHGAKMRYVDPATGAWPTPTLGAFLQLLPAGFRGAAHRSTDCTVFVCVEGEGTSQVGEERFDWTENDVFVAPPWTRVSHRAGPESVLFSFSDRPAQKALGVWREERLA